MTNTASKLKRALCSMVVMLALMAGISAIPAYAASPGIYTATATSHYKHPTTGVIEDSGGEGSYVLGQSMTDSALNKAALVEVDSSGATWVTIRLNLMDGSSVSATLMQEDYSNNTADYRMRVNSENSIIRCNMYVIPMGREVIFYITVGGLSAGSGDFVTSITVEEPEPVVVPEPEPEQPAVTTPQTQAPSTETPSEQAPSAEEPSAQPTEETPSGAEEPVTEEPVTEEPDSEISSDNEEDEESSEALGLEEFDASGNKVSSTSTEAEQGGTGNPIVWWIIGGIIVAAIAGGCVWYFCFFRKKK